MEKNLSWNDEVKGEICQDRWSKEAKVNVAKYNKLVRQRYCEIQYWSERKSKLYIKRFY